MVNKRKNIRILSLFSAPFWLIYNFANSAYSSVVGNVFVMVSIAIAMIRLDFNPGKKGSLWKKQQALESEK